MYVVIIEENRGSPPDELPDGLDNLASHNLLTCKSHPESLDGWTVDELMGHYVNYRKQISPPKKLLNPEDFRLYAVSTRYPEKLSEQVHFTEISPGVYDVKWGIRDVRIIGKEEKNGCNFFIHYNELGEADASDYNTG